MPGKRRALLWTDDVHDALPGIVHTELGDRKFGTVLVERLDLQARHRIGDAFAAISGRDIVIGRREVGTATPDIATRQSQTLERLRRGHFVDQVAVDVQQRRAIGLFADDVRIPELVVEGSRFHWYESELPRLR
jgi:hypothetical protein